MRRAAFVLAAAACGSSPPPPELAGAPTPAPPPGSGAAATAADALPTRDAPLRWRPLAPDRPFHAVRVVGSGTSPVRCALSRDGEVACWGRLDPTGSTPSAARAGVATPVVAEGIRGAIDLALASSGDAVCVAQRVGPGGCIPLAARPARAPFPKPIAQVVERDLNVCARYRDGTAGCLTYEGHVPLAGLTGATELACTHRTCCALTPAGARCVGPAFEGGGPAATAGAWPIVPPVPADAVELRVRDGELCVRTSRGAAVCRGPAAAALSRPSGVRRLVEVHDRLCLVLDDGALQCSGGDPSELTGVADAIDDCAAHRDGGVSCRGSNEHGELGDGAPLIVLEPRRVGAFDDIIDLRASYLETCAERRTGSLWCWGGQPLAETTAVPPGPLADAKHQSGCRIGGAAVECHAPAAPTGRWRVALPPGRPVASLAIDNRLSVYAADTAGAVAARFGDEHQNIGTKWRPVRVPGARRAVAIRPLASGACALLDDGRVACLVDDQYDDADYPAIVERAALVELPGVTGAVQLATGQHDACAITHQGEVWCSNVERGKAAGLPALRGATAIAGSYSHYCAVVRGEVWCWGEGGMGQLGDGAVRPPFEKAPPVRVQATFTAVRVGVGRDHSCALDDRGRVWCWGGDSRGALGQGRVASSHAYRRVVGLGARP